MSKTVPFVNQDPMEQKRRELWVGAVQQRISERLGAKFDHGALEHHCEFGDQTVAYLLDQIEDEAIDTLNYVNELRRRMIDAK